MNSRVGSVTASGIQVVPEPIRLMEISRGSIIIMR